MKKINLKENLWVTKWWIRENFGVVAAVSVVALVIVMGYLTYKQSMEIENLVTCATKYSTDKYSTETNVDYNCKVKVYPHAKEYARPAERHGLVPAGVINIGKGLCVPYAVFGDKVLWGKVEPMKQEYNGAAFIYGSVDKVGGRLVACNVSLDSETITYARNGNPIDHFNLQDQTAKNLVEHNDLTLPDILGVATDGDQATVLMMVKGETVKKTFSIATIQATVEEELGI